LGLQIADLATLLIPVALIVTNLIGANRDRFGKLVYLGSLCTLYAGVVLGLRLEWAQLVLVFLASASLFHAVEYLAVVTHYARRRETVGTDGRFRTLARHWLVFLGLYALTLGSVGAWMSRSDSGLVVLWQ